MPVAWAAPTGTEELGDTGVSISGKPATAPAAANTTGAPPALPAGGSSDQARTMELLLQLQDRPGAFAKDKANAASTPSLRQALTATAAGDVAASGDSSDVLGGLKKHMVGDSPPPAGARPETAGMTAAPGTADTTSTPRATTSEPRTSLLNNPVVRYIRENRVLVIAISLGLLAAVWLGAAFSMRRSR